MRRNRKVLSTVESNENNPVEEPPLKHAVSIFIARLDKTDKER
jgi:hypothetical protein